jgi:hypothetical protein
MSNLSHKEQMKRLDKLNEKSSALAERLERENRRDERRREQAKHDRHENIMTRFWETRK